LPFSVFSFGEPRMSKVANPKLKTESSKLLSASEQAAAAKKLAAEHGFTLSGIAHIPPDGAAPRSASLPAWLEQGMHGPLDYMLHTQTTRERPLTRFPWARSILALGMFYDGSERGERGKDLEAHIAGYARGRDYHRIFERRLKLLEQALHDAGVCSRSRHYVDTGPILERAWGEAAGLGWIGKNACLIHPKLGSFFLIAEIVMDSQPDADAPATDHCGTCTRCLDACPTQAFAAPGVLDARRCLVTWNIEQRGETPPELWRQQGHWAAGCDVCQTVCPYNATRPAGNRVRGEPDAELTSPLPWQQMSLSECIVMTPAEFDHAFRGSTLRRTGLTGLRLGAITAAANVKAKECAEEIRRCLTDRDGNIRARAEWALRALEG
jgi:epoxyqueuosine reductase